ncbi:probable G-protein coupled receptor 101 [Suncus etruscus]|uniref:probable G-protein coupled receptor 101 n=1 Tax=Suncus etruscus TaxID=109475 RepID=UPI0021100B75|nr:probable G-protein coupled receptor 101 [Suncus etruscus]
MASPANCTNETETDISMNFTDLANVTNITSTTCMPLSKMPISLAHGIIRSVVLFIFLIVSLIGNLVLAYVLQRKPEMMQMTNHFIFNLLVTDLLQVLLVAPWVVATSLPSFWPLNSHFCTALVSLTHLFAFASVNTIIVVSIDRYVTIIHPLSYSNKMTTFRGYMLLYGTWIVAFIQSAPPLYGWGHADFDIRNAVCFMFWGSSPSYTFVSVMFFLVIPLAVMIACYSVVYSAARRQQALMNLKSRRLDDQAQVKKGKKKIDKFQRENEVKSQKGGEAKASEGGMEDGRDGVRGQEESIIAKDGDEVVEMAEMASEVGENNQAEGEEEGAENENELAANGGSPKPDHCSIDMGDDEAECEGEKVNLRQCDIEEANIPENAQSVKTCNDPPMPNCCQCKATKVIFLIIFSYVLSLGPYCFLAVLAVWVDVHTKVPQWVITIIIWLFFLQCCIHPYIYGYMHKAVKKEIHILLKRLFSREQRLSPDLNLPATEAATEGGTKSGNAPSREYTSII